MSGYSGVAPVLTSLIVGHINPSMNGELASKTSAIMVPAVTLLAFIDSTPRIYTDATDQRGLSVTIRRICLNQRFLPSPRRQVRFSERFDKSRQRYTSMGKTVNGFASPDFVLLDSCLLPILPGQIPLFRR